jgi:hypothetical protein
MESASNPITPMEFPGAYNLPGMGLGQYTNAGSLAGMLPSELSGITGVNNAYAPQTPQTPAPNAIISGQGDTAVPPAGYGYGSSPTTLGLAGSMPGALSPYTGLAMGPSGAGTASTGATTAENLAGQVPSALNYYTNFATGSGGAGAAATGEASAEGAANSISGIAGQLPGTVNPYATQAAATGASIPGAISPYTAKATDYSALPTYFNPYQQDVTATTEQQFNQQNAIQQAQIQGNAAAAGAFGGDREAVAQALTAGQQQTAEAPVIAGIQQQGFSQAQQELNAEQQMQLGAGQLTEAGLAASGQLGLGAGQLAESGLTNAGQLEASAGQLGLGAGQLGLGVGQLGLGAGQLTESGMLGAGQLGLGAGQLGLGTGQLGLGAGQLTESGLTNAGQLELGTGQLTESGLLGAGQLGMGIGQGELGEFNTQQQAGVGAQEATGWLGEGAGYGIANLGNEALNTGLTGASSLLNAGSVQQAQLQNELNVPYEQFIQQQAYPFQTTGWLSNIAEGLGGASGGTGSTTYPGPNLGSELLGGGLAGAGILGATGAFGSSGYLSGLFGGSEGGDYGGGSDVTPWMGDTAKAGGRILGDSPNGSAPNAKNRYAGGGLVPPPPDLSVSVVPGASGLGTPPQPGSLGGGLHQNFMQPVTTQTQTQSGGSGALGGLLQAGLLAAKIFAAAGGRVKYDGGGAVQNGTSASMPSVTLSIPDLSKGYIPTTSAPSRTLSAPSTPSMPQQQNPLTQGLSVLSGAQGLGKLFNGGSSSSNSGTVGGGSSLGGAVAPSSSGLRPYDAGGGVAVAQAGAMASGAGAPLQQNLVAQYSQLPAEQLQELALRYPATTPQGVAIQRALQIRKMNPTVGTGAQGQATPTATAARGGRMGLERFDDGGSPGVDDPNNVGPPEIVRKTNQPSGGLDPGDLPITPVVAITNNGTDVAVPQSLPQTSALPPGVKINSKGMPYSTEPTGGVTPNTAGAGLPITPVDAMKANAADPNAGTHLPVVPSDQVFGSGLVAPPGAGVPATTSPVGGGMVSGGLGAPPPSAVKPLVSGKPPAISRDDVVNFWVNSGAPQHVAEGIADSVYRESHYDPNAWNPDDKGSPSGGLYQHHDTRLSGLQAFAAGQSGSWTDPNIQNQFALKEVTGGDPIATTHWKEILNAPDRASAQTLWDKYFERGVAVGPGGGGGGLGHPTGVQTTGLPSPPAAQGTTNAGTGDLSESIKNILAKIQSGDNNKTSNFYNSPWMPLIATGAGMLASRSPHMGVAVGEGLQTGLKTVEQQQAQIPEGQLKQAQADIARLNTALLPHQMQAAIDAAGGSAVPAAGGAPVAGAVKGTDTNPMPVAATGQGNGAATASAGATATSSLTGLPLPPTYGNSAPGSTKEIVDNQIQSIDAQIAQVRRAMVWEPTKLTENQATVARLIEARSGLLKMYPQVAGEIAGAEQKARSEYTYTPTRPGSVIFQGGKAIASVPTLTETTDAEGNKYRTYMAPPLPGNSGTPPQPQIQPQAQKLPSAAPTPAPAATNVSAASPTAPMLAEIGPGAREALVARAQTEQKDRQAVLAEAQSAQSQQATLQRLATDAPKFVQGPFAGVAQEASRYLRLIDPSYDGQVASFEDFVKNAGNLTRQATKEVSSRAAFQEMQFISSTLPSPEMSPKGLQQVVGEYEGLNDYKIAKARAQQQWEEGHGGVGHVEGFESNWQATAPVTPYTFVLRRMDPTERRSLFSQWQQTGDGQAVLQRLARENEYAKANGLYQ